MGKMSRLLMKIIGVSLITGALLGTPKHANADAYLYGGFRMGVSIQKAHVKTVPEYIRDVPVHPDDSLIQEEDIAPIEDKSLDCCLINASLLEGKVGIGMQNNRFDFKIGPELALIQRIIFPEIAEKEYTNVSEKDNKGKCSPTPSAPRLTFYQLTLDNNWFFVPGVSVKLSYSPLFLNEFDRFMSNLSSKPKNLCEETSLGDPMGGNLFLEYSAYFSRYPFYFENGWSRGNNLETYKKYDLPVNVIDHTIKAGYEIVYDKDRSSTVSLGLTIPQIIKKNSLADETGLTLSPSLYFGVGLEFNLNEFIKN